MSESSEEKSVYRKNNALILGASVVRHLRNSEDIAKHLGSPGKIIKTMKENVFPRVREIIVPQVSWLKDYNIQESSVAGLRTFNLMRNENNGQQLFIDFIYLPQGCTFQYLTTHGELDSNYNLYQAAEFWRTKLAKIEQTNLIIALKPGSTKEFDQDRQIRDLPSFGLALGNRVISKFTERTQNDQVQHGGFVINDQGDLQLLDYSQLKASFGNMPVSYQSDFFITDKDSGFDKVAKRQNMMQTNHWNLLGQFALVSGESKYFLATSHRYTDLKLILDFVKEIKQRVAPDAIETRVAGLEFVSGEPIVGRETKNIPWIVQASSDYIACIMPRGL